MSGPFGNLHSLSFFLIDLKMPVKGRWLRAGFRRLRREYVEGLCMEVCLDVITSVRMDG